jgi:hypothetical protein
MAKAKKPLSDLVPTNWCDPLLTGATTALPDVRAGAWNCRDIEALLRGIQDRIRCEEDKRSANKRGENGGN